jgi:hypothetical protein
MTVVARTNTEFLGYIGSKYVLSLFHTGPLEIRDPRFLPKSSPEEVALIGSLYPDDPSKVYSTDILLRLFMLI